MTFLMGSVILDAIVLAIVSKEKDGTYGYQVTRKVCRDLEISESTLYPVLRRLQKKQYLETYDLQFEGRNRRYYRITKEGETRLKLYQFEWKNYSRKITEIMETENYRVG